MANNVEALPGSRPHSLLTAPITVLSEVPKRLDSTRFPPAIKAEFGLERPLARCDQETSPELPGIRSNILRRAPGSSVLPIIPPRTAAMDESIPRATDFSGSPSEFAISETPVLSGVCSNEASIDSDILHSFVLHPSLAETQTPSCTLLLRMKSDLPRRNLLCCVPFQVTPKSDQS
jgi:hypothetical protein